MLRPRGWHSLALTTAPSLPPSLPRLAQMLRAPPGGRPFDIVLLDLVMPGMGGLRMLTIMKEDPRLSSVRRGWRVMRTTGGGGARACAWPGGRGKERHASSSPRPG